MSAEDRINSLETQVQSLTSQLYTQQSAGAQQAGIRLPNSVKVEKPQVFKGHVDASIVGNFLYQCELYFAVTGLQTDQQRVGFATLLLIGDAAIWLRTKFDTAQLATLSWPDFSIALKEQFLPIDHVRVARDELAVCTQTGNVQGYIVAFRRTLIKCIDVSAAEALDRFIRGLKPAIRQLVLIHSPNTFEVAAQIADRVATAGKHAVVSHGQPSSGAVPMELGQMFGGSRGRGRSGGGFGFGAGGRRGAWRGSGTRGGRFGGQRSENQRCYECGGYGHFKRDCPRNKGKTNVIIGSDGGPKNGPSGPVTAPAPCQNGSVSMSLGTENYPHKLLELSVRVGNCDMLALIDSGATHCFMSQNAANLIGLPCKVVPAMTVRLANGIEVMSTSMVTADIWLGSGIQHNVEFRVVPELSSPIILGMPWLKSYSPTIHWGSGQVSLADECGVQQLCCGSDKGENLEEPVRVELTCLKACLKAARKRNQSDCWLGLLRLLQTTTSSEGHSQYSQVLEEFSDVFGQPTLPPERQITHKIDLVDEDAPVPRQRIYRMSQPELAEVRRQLDDLLQKGWIRPSCSPYGHPVLFARKKDGTLRMCIDYRLLNRNTRLDRYPIPRIDAILDALAGSRVYSSIDLQSGYHQVRIAPGHEFKTAFTTRWGLFEFVVMPFGLCNAPATFQRLMNSVFREALDRFVVVYLDDILIFSPDAATHEKHLRWVFLKLREHQLYAKRSKCSFGTSEVSYLGHTISEGHIRMDQGKVDAIRNWTRPTCQREVQQFLGLANYYNRFIRNFSRIAAPLSDLTGKGVQFSWDKQEEQAFQSLKTALCSAPVLIMPNFEQDFVIETDASDRAVGAVLEQDQGAGLQPIAFFSRKLSPTEANYPTHEREQYAIVLACLKWRPYIDGRRTTVITDHAPLVHLASQPTLSKRQVHWQEKLSAFQLDIQYRPGPAAVVPDALSRLSTLVCEPGWLSRVYRAQTCQTDAEMQGVYKQAAGRDARFVLRDHDGLQLVYRVSQQGERLIIPGSGGLRELLCSELHDTLLAGHLGARKTFLALSARVWWPRMEPWVRQWVGSCPVCQRTKDDTRGQAGELQPLPVPQARFESWSIDFITHLPTSGGYNAIFTCVDRLSKLVRITPCTMGDDLSAGETARLFFDRVVRDFGVPRSIISDRDPRFTGEFWQALMGMLGTKLSFSTAFHPQTDGQTERAHRVIEQVLRGYVLDSLRGGAQGWHELLGHCEFALNSSVGASTGISPFELVYGQPVTVPIDRMDGAHRVQGAQETVDRVTQLVEMATRSLAKAQEYQKRAHDARHRPVQFAVGDVVLLSTRNMSLPTGRKLGQRFVGPFPIVARIGTQAYRLGLSSQYSQLHDVFHVSLLRKYTAPGIGRATGQGVPLELDEGQEFEVERILRHRRKRGRGKGLQFLVLWRGFDLSEATWIDESELVHAQGCLQDYWQSQGS